MNILQWIVVTSTVFGLSSGNPISAQCGRKNALQVQGMIRGGFKVSLKSWPWLAALFYKSENPDTNGKYFCAGTLISVKVVLTAAHCMQEKSSPYSRREEKRKNPSDFYVHLGRYDLSDKDELKDFAEVLNPIVIIAMVPDWNPTNYNDKRYDADIALLISGKEMKTNINIRPICLPNHLIPIATGTTVGWGFISDDKIRTEDFARQVQVEMVSDDQCFEEDFYLSEISSNRTFCVKGASEGASPCAGDSGGGFFSSSGDTWFIEGIVSAAMLNPNCPVSRHSLFTDVRPFVNWIKYGINKFYEVQFTYGSISWATFHALRISEVLKRGAFLSMAGHSVDLETTNLWCNDQHWEYLPNNIGYLFPNLKELKASYLKIKFIERMNFKNMGKLEALWLYRNQIEKIPSGCFDDLKDLVEIDIRENKLHNPSLNKIYLFHNQIQPTELKNLKNANVKILSLAWNQLESIPVDAFDGLPNIKSIDLHFNKLTTLHKDTFLNNLNLNLLSASNQIQYLPEGLFRNNKNLNYLDLSSNKITEINTTFQSLGEYKFGGNTCINKGFTVSNEDELNRMNTEIRRKCTT